MHHDGARYRAYTDASCRDAILTSDSSRTADRRATVRRVTLRRRRLRPNNGVDFSNDCLQQDALGVLTATVTVRLVILVLL